MEFPPLEVVVDEKSSAVITEVKERFSIQTISQLTREFLSLIQTEDPLVVDLGCGSLGRESRLLAESARVISLDLIFESVQRFKHRQIRAQPVQMDMRNLAFRNESLDGVWCFAAINYLLDGEQVEITLKGVRDKLKEKGVLFLANQHLEVENRESPTWPFSDEGLIEEVERAGFEIVKSEVVILPEKADFLSKPEFFIIYARKQNQEREPAEGGVEKID